MILLVLNYCPRRNRRIRNQLCIWYYNVHVSKLMSCQDFLFRLCQSESLPIYNLLRFCKIGTAHQTGFFFSRFLLDSVKSISWSAFYFKRGTCEFYVNDLFPQGLILKKNRKKTRSSVLVRHWQCWSKLSPTQIFSLISLINMSWRHLFSSGV